MKKALWLAVCATVLVAAVPATASTFLAMSQQELVAEADAVVEGTVISVESFRSESGRLILSEATVRVDDSVLGARDGVVVVRTAGGTVDGITVQALGFPEFAAGDRVFVFLREDEAGIASVVGHRLGQYRVLTNRFGHEVAVPTLERGVRLLTADGREAARPQAVKLDVLKEQVRELVAQDFESLAGEEVTRD